MLSNNREILLAIGVQRVETQQHDKFRQNRSIGCENIKIFRFFKMLAVRRWFIHLRAQGVSKPDEQPTDTPRGIWYTLRRFVTFVR